MLGGGGAGGGSVQRGGRDQSTVAPGSGPGAAVTGRTLAPASPEAQPRAPKAGTLSDVLGEM